MTVVQDILNVGVAAQSLALAGESVALAKKKNKGAEDFLKVGATALIGIPLIRAQSGIIAGL